MATEDRAARENFAFDHTTPAWLDIARRGLKAWGYEGDKKEAESLAYAVKLWAVVTKPMLSDVIRDELAPLPDLDFNSARWTLALAVNDYLKHHHATPMIHPYVDGTFGLSAEFTYYDDVGDAWSLFVGEIDGKPNAKGYYACGQCGRTFKPQRSTAVYCSSNCRVAAHMQRKREAEK